MRDTRKKSHLKEGVPIEDIGVSEQDARNMGIHPDQTEAYETERKKVLEDLESFDHNTELYIAMNNVKGCTSQLKDRLKILTNVLNKSFAKFEQLGYQQEHEVLMASDVNFQMTKLIDGASTLHAHALAVDELIQELIPPDFDPLNSSVTH